MRISKAAERAAETAGSESERFDFTMSSMREAADARKKFARLRPEFLARLRAITSNEVGSGSSLLSFQLQFEKFEDGILAAADKKMIAFHFQFGRRQNLIGHRRLPYSQIFSTKLRICARPRLKAPHAIQNHNRRAGELDEAIFFLEDRRDRGLGVILLARVDGAGL